MLTFKLTSSSFVDRPLTLALPTDWIIVENELVASYKARDGIIKTKRTGFSSSLALCPRRLDGDGTIASEVEQWFVLVGVRGEEFDRREDVKQQKEDPKRPQLIGH